MDVICLVILCIQSENLTCLHMDLPLKIYAFLQTNLTFTVRTLTFGVCKIKKSFSYFQGTYNESKLKLKKNH